MSECKNDCNYQVVGVLKMLRVKALGNQNVRFYGYGATGYAECFIYGRYEVRI